MSHSRNYKAIVINQRLTCSAFELSISDVLSFLFECSELTVPENDTEYQSILTYRIFNDERFSKFNIPVNKLNDAEKTAIFEHWAKTNDSFLNPPLTNYEREKRKTAKPKPIKIKKQYDSLCSDVAKLVRWGHVNILNYPYSLYVAVCKAVKEEAEEMRKNNG
jgi:hypothetical protein